MKKVISLILLATVLIASTAVSSLAMSKPKITAQPQNGIFPENSTAMWSVEAEGKDLVYEWYIFYKGVYYNTKKSFEENHPWQEGVLGDGYGSNEKGNVFFINGIGSALDGAEIYCVVSNVAGSVTSASAYIAVGGKKSPPTLSVPASVTCEQGATVKLRCKAEAADGDSVKSYQWYETFSGELKDIVAIGVAEGKEETSSVYVCGTSETGTRYYVCFVRTALGGEAYSSVIPVTVTKKTSTTSASSSSETEAPSSEPSSDMTQKSETSVEDTSANGSEGQDASGTDKCGISLPIIIAAVVGGLVVTGGIVAVIIIVIKKKK